MTVNSEIDKNISTANGSQTAFGFTFKIYDDAEMRVVTRNPVAGTETVISPNDYTVAGVGLDAGGTVTFDVAPLSGHEVMLRRYTSLIQNSDIRNQDEYRPEDVERAVDTLLFQIQRLQDEASRSIRVLESEAISASNMATLPAAADRANKVMAFDSLGKPIASATLPLSTVVTPYAAGLLNDADAAEAHSTLDMTGIGSHTQGLVNMSVACSVAASALTVSLKDKNGITPSAASPVRISFRSTAEDGKYVVRTITSDISVVLSSGSTLAHISAQAFPIFIYAIDNAGTVELAVSSTFFGDGVAINTTAEGGAGGADSGIVAYSTTARSNVSSRLIARVISAQATAGTWATAPILITSGALEKAVSSHNASPNRMEWAQVSLVTPSVVATSSNWLSTLTRPATGRLQFTVRHFQQSPIILVTAVRNLANDRYIASAWVSSISSGGNGLWVVIVEFAFYDDQAATIALAQSTDNTAEIFVLATGV